jgi:hypothetical protein
MNHLSGACDSPQWPREYAESEIRLTLIKSRVFWLHLRHRHLLSVNTVAAEEGTTGVGSTS